MALPVDLLKSLAHTELITITLLKTKEKTLKYISSCGLHDFNLLDSNFRRQYETM